MATPNTGTTALKAVPFSTEIPTVTKTSDCATMQMTDMTINMCGTVLKGVKTGGGNCDAVIDMSAYGAVGIPFLNAGNGAVTIDGACGVVNIGNGCAEVVIKGNSWTPATVCGDLTVTGDVCVSNVHACAVNAVSVGAYTVNATDVTASTIQADSIHVCGNIISTDTVGAPWVCAYSGVNTSEANVKSIKFGSDDDAVLNADNVKKLLALITS